MAAGAEQGTAMIDEQLAGAAQLGQCALGGIHGRGEPARHGTTVLGKHPGVDGIGLGEQSSGAREMAHLQRIKHAEGNAGIVQGGAQFTFVTAGGFHEDMGVLGQQREKGCEPLLGIGQTEVLATRQGAIQMGFADIDSDLVLGVF